MDTRRNFLKKSMLLSGAAGMATVLPESIARAAAIAPDKGTTYLDAEHVVILMQENRGFDHCYGTLQGVRGYNDPRAMTLPGGDKVWLQADHEGNTFVPFHFDIKDTKATWTSSTPHSRFSQVDAWNEGKYDNWIEAKRVGSLVERDIPLTMGYYARKDIPFHYALADAFTVCDQNFCSAMTMTNPNRLFFWAGTVKEKPTAEAVTYLRNLVGEWRWAALGFDTIPERLEDNGISWKYYQNDIYCGGGFSGEERSWLSNFGLNPLEWFKNYNVRFSERYVRGLKSQVENLPKEIEFYKIRLVERTHNKASYKRILDVIAAKEKVLQRAKSELEMYSSQQFEKLSPREKSLYKRAFTTNAGDPDYHKLTTLEYEEEGETRKLSIPKGDIFYQFRKDVENGELPTVSWLAAPKNFSDHPAVPWYGTYYLSEVLDILTKNPEVWKKTIFLITYDENDGYFDHVPPFVAPDPQRNDTGKCSPGIKTDVEYVHREEELKRGIRKKHARTGPIGLGYRVPLVIASPWSRGGKVCSEVFDHTSTIQFLETFCEKKLGKKFKEKNISDWRRTVTGDLTSVFSRATDDKQKKLPFLKKDVVLKDVYNAKFKGYPTDYRPLSENEIREINKNPLSSPLLPRQEEGIRPSLPLPYELYGDGKLLSDGNTFEITMAAKNELFGKPSAGCPFNIYTPVRYKSKKGAMDYVGYRSYAVRSGEALSDSWKINSFEGKLYHLCLQGPNGFFREFKGSQSDPLVEITCQYERKKGFKKGFSGNVQLRLKNLNSSETIKIAIEDNAYKNKLIKKELKPGAREYVINLDLGKSLRWYDFTLRVAGYEKYKRRYAGRVETGEEGFTDPVMGRVI